MLYDQNNSFLNLLESGTDFPSLNNHKLSEFSLFLFENTTNIIVGTHHYSHIFLLK